MCNGIDDDCNGAIDEDFVPSATACGVGACAAAGSTRCVAGSVVDSCAPGTPAPSDASCDGIDQDCSGTADQQYVSLLTTCGVGACAATGATSCVNGTVLDSCVAHSPAPADATCDGIDDDCNGQLDEDFVTVATSCGIGACHADGNTGCG
jgi:hypothetical protein